MSAGFLAVGAELAGHAERVAAIAARVQAAAGAARPLDRDAYGVVGQAFAMVVDETARTAAEAVSTVAQTFHDDAGALARTVESYRAVDGRIAVLFGSCG